MTSKSPRETTPPPNAPPGTRRTEPPRPEEELRGLPLFASIVAHEIRNPLSSVKIALQTVERHGQIGEKDGTRLRIALREVATIEKVLSDVLDWARPGEHPPEAIPVHSLVSDAVRMFEPLVTSGGILMEVDPPPDGAIVGDRARLTRALVELLQNSVDASPRNGIVRVRMSSSSSVVRIVVEDEGRGFTAEALDRAFDPFYTTRARGIGLGLPRARATARKHGGEVILEKRSEGGARAIMSLPWRPALDESSTPSHEPERA